MRKIKLTPLQNRMLWILEEAHEETLATVRNTLRAHGDNREEDISVALEGLRHLGFVERTDSSLILTDAGCAALSQ